MYEKAKTVEERKEKDVGEQKSHWVLGQSNMFDSFVEQVFQRK